MICDVAYNLEANPGQMISPHKCVMWKLEASSAQTLRTDLNCCEIIKKIYIYLHVQILDIFMSQKELETF